MTATDADTFMRLLDRIQAPETPLFYAESDGDPGRVEHYVCHTVSLHDRVECTSRVEARAFARDLNQINQQPFAA